MSVARDHEAVLWSDDVVVGFVGKTDFGVTNVWTQIALRCFANCGLMLLEDFNLATAKLAAWDYMNITWNPETIIAAGIEAKWKTDTWPLSQCLALIETSTLHISVKVHTVAQFLQLLRRSDCIEMNQSAVIQATLNSLGDARAVRWILRRLDHLFGIDIPSAEFVCLELKYWLRLR